MDQDTKLRVAEGNRSQWDAWDGEEGAYWAEHADLFDDSLRDHQPLFLEAAGIRPDDRVLDVGCGAGQTTLVAARRAETGQALGVDLSSAMLRVARQRAAAAGVDNATFLQADAQVHPFPPAAHDLVISRTGAMFFADVVAALANLEATTVRGGRLVLLTWQPPTSNEWFTTFTRILAAGRTLPFPPPGAPGPFALSDPERIPDVLEQAGWGDVGVESSEAPMYFGPDAPTAARFIAGLLGWLLDGLDGPTRTSALGELEAAMRSHQTDSGVAFGSSAYVVTARR